MGNDATEDLSGIEISIRPLELQVLLGDGAKVPTRARPGDAGYDFYAPERIVLHPDSTHRLNTNVRVAIPEEYCGIIFSRSSQVAKGVQVGPGIIDSGYRGDVNLILHNHSREKVVYEAGDRVGQMVLIRYLGAPVRVVEQLDETERGTGGFGSTGR